MFVRVVFFPEQFFRVSAASSYRLIFLFYLALMRGSQSHKVWRYDLLCFQRELLRNAYATYLTCQ